MLHQRLDVSGLKIRLVPLENKNVALAHLCIRGEAEQFPAVPLDGEKVGKPVAHCTEEYGRLRAVAKAPDGSLWVGTSNTDGNGRPRAGDDRLLRVTLD